MNRLRSFQGTKPIIELANGSTRAFLSRTGNVYTVPIILSVDDKGNRRDHDHLRVFADLDKVRWCGTPMSRGATASEIELCEQVGSRALMLFDGLCGLCNSAVRWVNQHDHADRFRFAPLQSELTAAILSRHGINREAVLQNNTVYLVLGAGTDRERLLTQSNVTVNMLLLLGGRWRVLGYLLRAVPTFLRNATYGLFARNRYRLTGRYEVCPLPTDAERMKFLS